MITKQKTDFLRIKATPCLRCGRMIRSRFERGAHILNVDESHMGYWCDPCTNRPPKYRPGVANSTKGGRPKGLRLGKVPKRILREIESELEVLDGD